MRKLLAALLLLLLVLSGAYCAASYWVGAQAQKQYERLLTQTSHYGSIEITTQKYERGVFHSRAITSVAVRMQGTGEALHFTLADTIQHGPLAFLTNPHATRRFQPVQAVISTRLAPSGENGKWLKNALEKIPELGSSEIWTVLFLDGSGESYMDVPSFQKKLPDSRGGELFLDWGGFHARTHFDMSLNEATGSFAAPRVNFTAGDETLNVHDTKGDFSGRNGWKDIALGGVNVSCDNIAFTSAAGNVRLRLAGPGIEIGSGASGNTMNGSLRAYFEKLETNGDTYGPFTLELEARKLDPEALSRFQRNVKELGMSGKSGEEIRKALNSCYLQLLTGLAVKSPELELKALRLESDKGEANAKAKFAMSGSGFSLDNPLLLLTGISASADVYVSEPLLVYAVEAGYKGAVKSSEAGPGAERADIRVRQKAAKMLQLLEAQKILMREGESFKLSAAYKSGRITVNGRKIPLTDLLKGGSLFE